MALALNSKTGCFNCRRKRVKCDETHPACSRCRRMDTPCIWMKHVTISSNYVQSNTTIGNTYAHLFLQDENVDFETATPQFTLGICPIRQISPGYQQFNNEHEHHNLVKLASFLSMLTLDHRNVKVADTKFEFTVALQETWVRDALLAFAGFINGHRDRASIWKNVIPYYTSATRAVQYYLLEQLDEARLEQLLIASQFLGMIEITNPQNEIFPLLHFEAVGRILEALHNLQKDRILSPATTRFHRVALESYLYHVAIQSMYYPQADRYPTMTQIYEPDHELRTTNHETNIIVKLDLRIYTILLHLTCLARTSPLNPTQHAQAITINTQIQQIETHALTATTAFAKMTLLGTSALTILASKVLDHTLQAKSPKLRPLVTTLLTHLSSTVPSRQWTGDFVWVLTIAACAVYTHSECQRFKEIVQRLSPGFWGSDLKRMKAVLRLVRERRIAVLESATKGAVGNDGVEVKDTLDLLVGGGIGAGL